MYIKQCYLKKEFHLTTRFYLVTWGVYSLFCVSVVTVLGTVD